MIPANAQQLDRTGYSVIPGLVGMHNHLFYAGSISLQRSPKGDVEEPGLMAVELAYTAPRLYLAAGVTTMRTTGSVEPYTDLKIKQRIDAGQMPGPKIDVTAPYLEGGPSAFAQMHELTGADDAKQLVDYWADKGTTSYKAYMHISRDELGAAIQQAHARHFKLTGHLCSVTWHEAIALGIDDLEHGPVFTDTEFAPDKKPDVCPQNGRSGWTTLEIDGPQVQALIQDLVSHHVAVTSTLPVFEAFLPGRPKLQQRVLDAMCAESAQSYLTLRGRIPIDSPYAPLYKKELEFELAFAKAGGLLLGGPDPTGNGGVLPGFGDQREVELLVEAGFTPVEAIQIAHDEWRDVSRTAGSHRIDRRGQAGGPGADQGRSFEEDRRHRKCGDGVQGRSGIRFAEADRERARAGGDSVSSDSLAWGGAGSAHQFLQSAFGAAAAGFGFSLGIALDAHGAEGAVPERLSGGQQSRLHGRLPFSKILSQSNPLRRDLRHDHTTSGCESDLPI